MGNGFFFRDSPGLITIELQNNPLERVNAGPFLKCRSLIYLDISNCGLSHLNDEFFSEVPFLTTLYLSGNPLTEISLRLLSSLVTLEELKLSQCNLTHLHPEFLHDLIHLKLLDLSQNSFKVMQDWATILARLPRLETLSLERSGLTGLPDDVFSNNSWIRNVDLSDNDFSETDIGTTLGDNLRNLHHLDLGNCSLRSLDERSFANAEKLRTLYLCNNNLLPRELLTALIPLKKLTNLSLRNCSLTRLPKNIFENLTELRDLDISWNPLSNVFEELLQPLQQLEYLNMGYSNLNKLAKNTFSQTTNLKKLVLSGNKLGDLETGLFKELTKLEILEMNYCGLGNPLDQDVFFNETYTELQELRMAGNPLKIHDGPLIPEQLSKLKILDLSNCSISYLPEDAFWNVRNLTHLYLHTNRLNNEAAETLFIKDLRHLIYLDLSSNNFSQLSVVFAAGTDLQDIKFTNNPWLCDCNVGDWWNWARVRGGVSHLIGATLTEEDIVKGGNKRKKALLCTVDPIKSPIKLRKNANRRTRVETATKTWARYLKESPCFLFKVQMWTTTVRVPVLFPEPILPSPGSAAAHTQDEKVESLSTSPGLEVRKLPTLLRLGCVVICMEKLRSWSRFYQVLLISFEPN